MAKRKWVGLAIGSTYAISGFVLVIVGSAFERENPALTPTLELIAHIYGTILPYTMFAAFFVSVPTENRNKKPAIIFVALLYSVFVVWRDILPLFLTV